MPSSLTTRSSERRTRPLIVGSSKEGQYFFALTKTETGADFVKFLAPSERHVIAWLKDYAFIEDARSPAHRD